MVKVDIYSGFLGAGKTTLLRKMISECYQNEKVVLVENEFGEIGVDGDFLKDAGIEVREMNSGCICCSLVGDFETSLKQVVKEYEPDRILIEPSGVGKLSDVMKAVEAVKDCDLVLNHLVCVVDVNKCKMYMKNFKEFFENQIAYAKTIVCSRCDIAKEEKIKEAIHLITECNKDARLITTPLDKVSGEALETAMSEEHSYAEKVMAEEDICPECGHHHEHHEHHHHDHEECCCGHEHHHEHHHHEEECCCGHDHEHDHEECCCGHDHEHHAHHHDHEEGCCCGHDHEHHHHHHADDVFISWGKETPVKYTKEQLEHILHTLSEEEGYGTILRAKGMVDGSGVWYYFDLVPGQYEIREGNPEVTGKLCVIGSKLDTDKLEQLFEGK